DPKETPVRVAALIHLGRGNGYDYNCGLLGTAKDMNDAAFQWGAVTWTASGVELGRAPTMKIINRAEFENHR
nr:hypothetical protein [Polyangiaceae bacterium]